MRIKTFEAVSFYQLTWKGWLSHSDGINNGKNGT